MASSCPSPLARLSLERRPKLLKEFLLQDDPYSCSSNPKKLCKSNTSTQNFHGSRINIRSNNKGSSQLLRSRSSRAATATISAIHKVINIVKFLPFASVKKSPSIFPRSISRKLSRRINHKKGQKHGKNNVDRDVAVTVKVKDILRWKSFRDLAEEKSTPLDSSYSPYRCATATTTTTTTTTTSSKRTSWCDSDFTAEDLPSWWGENGEFLGELLEDGMKKVGRKNMIEQSTVGGYCMGTTKSYNNNKEELCFDENEQHSPVSVLESPFQEDDDEEFMDFSFHKRKSILMQRIQQFESLAEENSSPKREEEKKEDEEIQEIEEKAKQLLINCEANYMDDDQLLFDFFWNELITSGKHQNNIVDEKLMMREAKSWISGDYNGEFEWEIEDKREAYIKDMERVANWNNFEEEKQEFVLDLEFQVFNDLVHEVLEDVFSHNI
ncbi:putative UDP-galactose/UDP-glucose transporter 4-like [Capsicum annuum]|nr:putative UDP-galactose/UDP-glucose transporter 4-like [Capsicum annuum]KAF3632058.1 putative UDP-galactose/UDP-glucose transporter 4-like [Capsicum annuum]